MVKKSLNVGLLVFVVLLLVVGGLYFFGVPQSLAIGKSSISHAYHTHLDRFDEGILFDLQTNCAGHNGDWFDSRGLVGCFDIRIPWDSSICNHPSTIVLENICDSLEGSTWVCESDNVGCTY